MPANRASAMSLPLVQSILSSVLGQTSLELLTNKLPQDMVCLSVSLGHVPLNIEKPAASMHLVCWLRKRKRELTMHSTFCSAVLPQCRHSTMHSGASAGCWGCIRQPVLDNFTTTGREDAGTGLDIDLKTCILPPNTSTNETSVRNNRIVGNDKMGGSSKTASL